MLLSPRDLRTGFGRLSIIFPWSRKAFQNETLCQFYENRTFQTSKYADFDFFAPGSFHGFWSWKFIKITNWHNIVSLLYDQILIVLSPVLWPNFPKNEHFLPPYVKCSFFGKFGVLCFLETPVLRFAFYLITDIMGFLWAQDVSEGIRAYSSKTFWKWPKILFFITLNYFQ